MHVLCVRVGAPSANQLRINSREFNKSFNTQHQTKSKGEGCAPGRLLIRYLHEVLLTIRYSTLVLLSMCNLC